MLHLHFSGYFQYRVATDPDPADETRGVSGFTFAVGREPDLDHILRFHDPVAPRSHGPKVGVFVDAVSSNGRDQEEHPLLGARLDLLGDPKIESRNYVIRESSQGPIVPFHLRLTSVGEQKVCVERIDQLHPDPELPLYKTPFEYMVRRGAILPMTLDPVRIRDATGMTDPVAFRLDRKKLLEKDLATESDPAERAGLEKRISELSLTDPQKMQILTLHLYNDYRFDIEGPATVVDAEGALAENLNASVPWPIAFWMGAWDSDALCGYISGLLTIPTGEVSSPKK